MAHRFRYSNTELVELRDPNRIVAVSGRKASPVSHQFAKPNLAHDINGWAAAFRAVSAKATEMLQRNVQQWQIGGRLVYPSPDVCRPLCGSLWVLGGHCELHSGNCGHRRRDVLALPWLENYDPLVYAASQSCVSL